MSSARGDAAVAAILAAAAAAFRSARRSVAPLCVCRGRRARRGCAVIQESRPVVAPAAARLLACRVSMANVYRLVVSPVVSPPALCPTTAQIPTATCAARGAAAAVGDCAVRWGMCAAGRRSSVCLPTWRQSRGRQIGDYLRGAGGIRCRGVVAVAMAAMPGTGCLEHKSMFWEACGESVTCVGVPCG